MAGSNRHSRVISKSFRMFGNTNGGDSDDDDDSNGENNDGLEEEEEEELRSLRSPSIPSIAPDLDDILEDVSPTPTPTPPPDEPPDEHLARIIPQFNHPKREENRQKIRNMVKRVNVVSKWRDTRTVTGKVTTTFICAPTQRITYRENRIQASAALETVNLVTKPPLSKIKSIFFRVLAELIFLANLTFALYDIITGPEFLYFKVTAFLFGVFENLLMFTMWFILSCPCMKGEEEKTKKVEKYRQYIENVVHELLIYPAIIINVIAIATEQSYTFEEVAAIITMALLFIDGIDLIFNVYTVRMFMAWKITRNIEDEILKVAVDESNTLENATLGGSKFGRVLQRFYFTMLGNTMLMGLMLCTLGVQVLYDNQDSGDYTMSLYAILQIVLVLFFPFYSIFLFIAVNYFWIFELFISINRAVMRKKEIQENLVKDYGEMVGEVLNFAIDKSDYTEVRHEDIQTITSTQKFFYALWEWWIAILLLMWPLMYAAFGESLNVIDVPSAPEMKVAFYVTAAVVNLQVCFLSICMLVIAVLFLAGGFLVIIYYYVVGKKKSKVDHHGKADGIVKVENGNIDKLR
ncbi:uncharacterized protein LOC106150944 [Lingula anatina]|uniref:Uncharacterized protein LOC106150944 n=1 Tax=Lingula anatina TaxID=7574 RepID=A0A1S3H2R9_LINAN|nr:uncharacterized protein LOC106150944 [Lingula anatina]|eukprot:XP_013379434.1 uncharacterized protein LOC106150944 [Lingula anatina]